MFAAGFYGPFLTVFISQLWLTLQSRNLASTFLTSRGVCWIVFEPARSLCCNLHNWGLASSDKRECGMVRTMGEVNFG